MLDYGCGVRFATTIYNLELPIGLYAGVDVNADMIAWLSSHVDDARFSFHHLDMRNAMYNTDGAILEDSSALHRAGLQDFDAACMFSVITHQGPADARRIFGMLSRTVVPGGLLYFTAFTDDGLENYCDRDPSAACHLATYHPDSLRRIASDAGWAIEDVYARSQPTVQQTAFVCRRRIDA